MESWRLYHSTLPTIPETQNNSIPHRARPMLHTGFKLTKKKPNYLMLSILPRNFDNEKTVTFPTVSAMRSIQGSGNEVPLSHTSSSFAGS